MRFGAGGVGQGCALAVARRLRALCLTGANRRALHVLRALTAALPLWLALTVTSAAQAPEGHCRVAAPEGGCIAGPVTDADGILLPGAHIYFSTPTTRYAHGVLGDAVEWGSLIYLQQGSAAHGPYVFEEVVLPEARVFEDLTPRLVDLDGDGAFEIIVVESDNRLGAQLAIYAIRDLALVKIAETPHIGTAHRWLAPIGAADLDGDGHVEIAYIDRPHLAKTLRVWRFANDQLTEVAALKGFSNHRIGEDFITSGIRNCGQGAEIITADGQWRNVMATRLINGQLQSRPLGAFRGASSVKSALSCKSSN